MNLKNDVKKFLLWIMILIPTLSVSQKVVIDSIKKTTLLDKKATIAQGNISKQRDSLIKINKDQERLIDSLRKESNAYKDEADNLRNAFTNLKNAFREQEIQMEAQQNNFGLQSKLFDAKIKAIRRKRLGLGFSFGYGFAEQGQTIFGGLSINYTAIRF